MEVEHWKNKNQGCRVVSIHEERALLSKCIQGAGGAWLGDMGG